MKNLTKVLTATLAFISITSITTAVYACDPNPQIAAEQAYNYSNSFNSIFKVSCNTISCSFLVTNLVACDDPAQMRRIYVNNRVAVTTQCQNGKWVAERPSVSAFSKKANRCPFNPQF